jgi:predicted CoA-binding protein
LSERNSDQVIARILSETRTIALIGASKSPLRPSHSVMSYLQGRGYRVIPVNPGLAGQSLLGETVRASLSEIDEPVDMVDIFRRSDAVPQVVDDAIAKGAKTVWMQLGVRHDAAAAKAEAAGLTVITERCPAIEIPRLGL